MTRAWIALLFAASALSQQVVRERNVNQLFLSQHLDRYDPAEPAEGQPLVWERLERLLRLMMIETNGRQHGVVHHASSPPRGKMTIVIGSAENVAMAKAVFEQLGKHEPLRTRLQCSVLSMPKALAAAHGLTTNGTRPADDATIAKLARDAVKGGGTLHNFAELTMSPLARTEVDAGGKLGTEERREYRLQAEMIPLADDRAAVAFDLARRLPKTPEAKNPTSIVTSPIVDVKAGASSLTLSLSGDTATVLVVRCQELAAAPLQVMPAPTGKR